MNHFTTRGYGDTTIGQALFVRANAVDIFLHPMYTGNHICGCHCLLRMEQWPRVEQKYAQTHK